VLSSLAAHAPVPAIVFSRGAAAHLDELAATGACCVGVDWTIDIGAARRRIGSRVAVQGNLDPVALLTNPETVAAEARRIVLAAGPQPGHVFNLGHGIVPATPPEHVRVLVDTVHEASQARKTP
jgi:uroporphyrinogen decarboxylase